MRTVRLSMLLIASTSLPSLVAQEGGKFQRPEYTIYRTANPLRIDGKLDEPEWKRAVTVSLAHFPWHKDGDKEQSRAMLLWDDNYLYIAHTCRDAWITARCREHDGPVARDDCFEVMVAPNADRPSVYFNIEWNVLGTWVDNHRPNGPKQPRAAKWDAERVRIAGKFRGTLNDDSDRDQDWTCEVAIPFSNFRSVAGHSPPRAGEHWYLNLNRHGGDTNRQFSQWSPGDTPAPSFHTPHRFGRVTFSAASVPDK